MRHSILLLLLLLLLPTAAACAGGATTQRTAATPASVPAAGDGLLRLETPAGVVLSYSKYGSGPPLVLVHGGFSDHATNWELVAARLARSFTVHAVARRGRGATARTTDHRLADEAADVVALLERLDRPAFLLGHSYGAQVALVAASRVPARVAKLVLYEPPSPGTVAPALRATLTAHAVAGDWDRYATTFFGEGLHVPAGVLAALRASPAWAPIVADAAASAHDVRALGAHSFVPEDYRGLHVPVLLQVGEHSPRELYVTDALARVLPDVRIETLAGQAHEGMTTAPDLWAASVERFLAR